MSKRLTAEQVADELERLASDWNEQAAAAHNKNLTGVSLIGAANELRAMSFSDAAKLIRDNLIESPDERRERFEQWHRDRFGDDESAMELLEKDEDGGYESGVANAMWLAFNAALDFRGDT